jgi:hypothetical protein
MSETAWIIMTAAAWLLVMGAISVFGEIAKDSDRARHNLVDDRLVDDRRAPQHRPRVPRQAVGGRAH